MRRSLALLLAIALGGCAMFGSERAREHGRVVGERLRAAGFHALPADTPQKQAHLEGMPLVSAGHTHSDLLEHGWAWRIPLPGRVSVGLVIDHRRLQEYGATVEAQFDGYLARDPHIARWGGSPRRVS